MTQTAFWEKQDQRRGNGLGELGLGKILMSRQIDKKTTKQIRIDAGWHKILKIRASELETTIKSLLEEILADSELKTN